MSIQLALGGWLSQHSPSGIWSRLGILLIDGTLASLAAVLLFNSYRRRNEVIATLKNVNSALGFYTEGTYLPDSVINPSTRLYQ